MKDESTFFSLLQDPLLSLTALILIFTMWMIIPNNPAPATIPAAQTDNEAIARTQWQIDSLRQELTTIEARLREIESRHAPSEHNDNQEQKYRQYQQDIIDKNRQLETLKKRLQQNSHTAGQTEQMQNRLQVLDDTLKALQARNERMEKQDVTQSAPEGGGFSTVYQSDKKPVYFELVHGKLYPVTTDYYEKKVGYIERDDGSTVDATQMTRKSWVNGVTLASLAASGNELRKTLKSHDNAESRVVFLLHNDSYPIFRKAREIARKQGFETGWWPFSAESIVMVHGDSDDANDIPSDPTTGRNPG